MDYKHMMFVIGFSCLLILLTYGEFIYKRNKQTKLKKVSLSRIERFLEEAKMKREVKKKLAEKGSMIDYYMRFRLEYDSDTHTYIKVETVPDKETDLLKIK